MNREEPSASAPARDKQAEEDLWQRHKAERGVWTEPMLVALEGGLKGKKWFSLIDKVSTERTLQLAWEKARRNAGSCGVDGITIGHFEQNSQSRLLAVKEHLSKGTYQPKPVKRVWIDKPGSAEKRPLGIPTVTDRVVQKALRMVIEPIFENRFAEHIKHAKASELSGVDGWIRMRLRSILRKRRGLEGRGRGIDHQRWPNRYFKKLGLFCLLDAQEAEIASLRNGVNC